MMIVANQITIRRGKKTVVHPLSFQVQEGEIFGILGSNGAGKSSLLATLATLRPVARGDVFISGHSLEGSQKFVRRAVGFVSQELALWDGETVETNMRFFAKVQGVEKDPQFLQQLCEQVSLPGVWKVPVHQLSGGMKRKLHIAIGLLHDPKVLLLDEPTVGIDLPSKREIGEFLTGWVREGRAVCYTTHDASEVERLCNRMMVLAEGRISFHGTPSEARSVTGHSNTGPFEDVFYDLLGGQYNLTQRQTEP